MRSLGATRNREARRLLVRRVWRFLKLPASAAESAITMRLPG